MMTSILTRKEFSFVWNKDSMRHATITFDASAPNGVFVFTGCKFDGVGHLYNLDDWEFIGELSKEILKLVEHMGGK